MAKLPKTITQLFCAHEGGSDNNDVKVGAIHWQ